MLNTFENAERQQLRRKERDRHLKAIDDLADNTCLPLDGRDLSRVADSLVGAPLAKQPPPPPVASRAGGRSRRSRRKLAWMIMTGALLGVMIGLLLGTGRKGNEREVPTVQTKDIDDSGRARYNRLFSLILDWQVTPRWVLEEQTSPPAQALHWLAYEDLSSDHVETIRTRYALAALYFSTHGNFTADKSYLPWKVETHWLSSYPVCLWHGVECFDRDDEIGLVESIDLQSNGKRVNQQLYARVRPLFS